MTTGAVDVRFLVTPFLPEHQPALGVSNLQAVLNESGVRSDIIYLNIRYLAEIGRPLYFLLSRGVPTEYLLGEMIFARALWGDLALWDEYERQFRQSFANFARQVPLGLNEQEALEAQEIRWDDVASQLKELHFQSPALVKQWARDVFADQPPIIGFTSTFQQNIASLAVAKELRKLDSGKNLRILMGGANCEDDMGRALAENFPFLDSVVSGEGEPLIVSLAKTSLHGNATAPRFAASTTVQDMNTLPVPSFDDFFAAIKSTEREHEANLVAESSRGCWWGMKSHCTFCGLNGTTMNYRSKNPLRFAEEIKTLARRYGRNQFYMADNILDLSYIQSLFPEIASEDLNLFYETKSNLRKDQLELMAAGGIDVIQPGIESLSTEVLKLMGKGTSKLQNIQLLKWCEEFRVAVKWNLLYGFPGENPLEYEVASELMPLLSHLPPPSGCARIRLDRFSPYWRTPERYGMCNVRPFWSYDFAYAGLPAEQRRRIAYFFEYDYEDKRTPDSYARPAVDAANDWVEAYKTNATLEILGEGADYYVIDRRPIAREMRVALSPVQVRVLKLLDSARGAQNCLASLNDAVAVNDMLSAAGFTELVNYFKERRWIIEESGRLLSLVLDRSEQKRVVSKRVALQMAGFGLAAFNNPYPSAPARTNDRIVV